MVGVIGNERGRKRGRACTYLQLELGQMLNDAQGTLLHRLGQGNERLTHGPGETDGHIREGLDPTHEDEAGLIAQNFLC